MMMMTQARPRLRAIAALGVATFCLLSFDGGLRNNRVLSEIDHKENIRLLEDGTLLIGRQLDPQTCRYFVDVPLKDKFDLPFNVSSMHYHFDDCSELDLGRRLGEHFGHQLLAAAVGIPYSMTCGSDDGEKQQVLLPNHPHNRKGDSVLKYLEVQNHRQDAPRDLDFKQWTPLDVCMNCYGLSWWCPTGPQLLDTSDQLWELADPTIRAEDAIIHLRLGDVFGGGPDEGRGLLPFSAYSKLLHEASRIKEKPIQSIGIVTQPFDPRYTRSSDAPWTKRSHTVAIAFVEYLLSQYPDASVSLYNRETSRAAFTRLMKAKVASICGSTNYCTYPVLANRHGIGFLFKGDRLSAWTKHTPLHHANIRSWTSPRLANNFTNLLTDEQLVHWLKNQEAAGEDVIYGWPLFRSV